jgi:hypothetical protein
MPKGPRISLNKLGEYMVAHAVRRRSIIKGQKEPPSAVVPRYQKAFPILEKFFATGDPEHIYSAIDKLRSKTPKSDWDADDTANTALALETFLDFASEIDLADCSVTRADPQETAKLIIAGVDVSVRPDFYIRLTKRKKDLIGALKFHWTKDDGHELTADGGTYVATTVHQFLEKYHSKTAKPSLEHCLSVDVFRRAVRSAPTGYKRLRDHIEASCEEIALRWDKV